MHPVLRRPFIKRKFINALYVIGLHHCECTSRSCERRRAEGGTAVSTECSNKQSLLFTNFYVLKSVETSVKLHETWMGKYGRFIYCTRSSCLKLTCWGCCSSCCYILRSTSFTSYNRNVRMCKWTMLFFIWPPRRSPSRFVIRPLAAIIRTGWANILLPCREFVTESFVAA